MKIISPFWLISFFIIFIGTSACDAQSKPTGSKEPIELNLQKGKKYQLIEKLNFRTSLTPGDQKIESQVAMQNTLGFEVLQKESDGTFLVKITTDHIKADTSVGPMKMSYDSSEPEKSNMENLTKTILESQLKTYIKMRLGPHGEIEPVPGGDNILSEGLDYLPASKREAMAEAERNKIVDKMKSLFSYLPLGPVDVNDKWVKNVKGPFEINGKYIDLKSNYILSQRKKDQIKIEVLPEKIIEGGLEGKSEGVYYLNRKTGWPEKCKVRLKLLGNNDGVPFSIDGELTLEGESQ